MNEEHFYAVPQFKPAFKARLEYALRNGNHPQTRGKLFRGKPDAEDRLDGSLNPIGYCCLGVACIVDGSKRATEELHNYHTPTGFLEEQWFDAFQKDIGNDVPIGLIARDGSRRVTLVWCNDGGIYEIDPPMTFAQIADVIRYFL
jgi:hypothetical protein